MYQTIKIRIPSENKVHDNANIPINSTEISQKPQINTDKLLINNDSESRRGRTINLDDLKIQNKEIYEKCTDSIIFNIYEFLTLDDVYCYTNFGEIMGIMKIDSYLITFDPIKFNDTISNPKKGIYSNLTITQLTSK